MTIELVKPPSETPVVDRAIGITFSVYLRLLSMAFLGLTLVIWLQVIGYWDGPNSGFDNMSPAWRIYAAMLAVLNPIASVGLWTTLPWGRVVWFMALAVQMAGLTAFSTSIGTNQTLVYFHMGTLAIYVMFLLALRFVAKKA